jgi:diacylglycerol diphosphate phosphatase / phosphatidate phosphatase
MLPFHRREHRREVRENEKHVAPAEGRGKGLWRFFVDWVKVSWKDVLWMAILGGASQGVSPFPSFHRRRLPLTHCPADLHGAPSGGPQLPHHL